MAMARALRARSYSVKIRCTTEASSGSITRSPVVKFLDEATGRADLLDPDYSRAFQVCGAERRAAGSNGITWPSIRYPESQ
jgi:hypothetical protein